MTAIPQREHGTAQAIYDLYARRAAKEAERTYLGWSEIGGPCERALWYGFRQCGRKPTSGQMARLFDTGHREEARVLDELRAIGCEVWSQGADGRQFEVSSVGGHLRGHADAVVLGLPEAPKTPHLVDVKSIKGKKMDELLKKGMPALFPKYMAQGHGYATHLGLERCAFIFSCKDDDRIHVERFEPSEVEAARLEDRAIRIVRADSPLPRLSEDPEWFECRFCDFSHVCHGADLPPTSCRTCAHATPVMDGQDGAWRCELKQRALTLAEQRKGCPSHLYIPPLLERIGRPVDGDSTHVVYETAEGGRFVNGPAPGFSSIEIRVAGDKRALCDASVQGVKAAFPTARVTA